MKISRSGGGIVAGFGLAAMVLAWPAGPAGAALITEAPTHAVGDAQGPAPFRYYGAGGSRVQEMFAAAFFSGFAGPRAIDRIAFRSYPGASPNLFFGNTVSFSDVVIRLSTTTRGDEAGTPLSTSFADNQGADAATVYSGALTLTTAHPGSFDYVVNLSIPFVYDPSAGNLLLDVNVPAGATVGGNGAFGFLTFDTVNDIDDGIYSVVNINDGSAVSGVADTSGAIAQFTSTPVAAPEPAGLALFGFGLLGVALLRRRSG